MKVVERRTIRKSEVKDRLQLRSVKPLEGLERLKADIKASGLIHNLLVEELPGGGYRLIAGGLRYESLPEDAEIPVVVAEFEDDADRVAASLRENLQRAGLNVVDEAVGYVALERCGLSSTDIARRVWRDERKASRVRNLLRLVEKAEPDVLALLAQGEIGLRVALDIIRLPRPRQREAVRRILLEGLSADAVRSLVEGMLEEEKAQPELRSGREGRRGVFTVNSLEGSSETVECRLCGSSTGLGDARLVWVCKPCLEKVQGLIHQSKPPQPAPIPEGLAKLVRRVIERSSVDGLAEKQLVIGRLKAEGVEDPERLLNSLRRRGRVDEPKPGWLRWLDGRPLSV